MYYLLEHRSFIIIYYFDTIIIESINMIADFRFLQIFLLKLILISVWTET